MFLQRVIRPADQKLMLYQDAGGAATAALKKQNVGPILEIKDGVFTDYRWKDGRWDLSVFTGADQKVDWDAVSAQPISKSSALPHKGVAAANAAFMTQAVTAVFKGREGSCSLSAVH